MRVTGVIAALALLGAVLSPAPAAGGVHKGNYTCYQAGTLYWGYFAVKGGKRYEIANGGGKFKKKGKKLVFKSGSLKKWGWKGKYSTGRSAGGEREWQIDLIDRKNGIKINCYD